MSYCFTVSHSVILSQVCRQESCSKMMKKKNTHTLFKNKALSVFRTSLKSDATTIWHDWIWVLFFCTQTCGVSVIHISQKIRELEMLDKTRRLKKEERASGRKEWRESRWEKISTWKQQEKSHCHRVYLSWKSGARNSSSNQEKLWTGWVKRVVITSAEKLPL